MNVQYHIAGTSYHKVNYPYRDADGKSQTVASWIAYWQHHTGLPIPVCCPGRKDLDQKDAHAMGEHVKGAHVRLIDAQGNVKFAIVPSCSKCNNTNNEWPLVWSCKAVTIVNNNRFDFVGKLYLKEDNKPSPLYWKEVTGIADCGTVGKPAFSITGITNKNAEKTCIYNDPDDFLHFLSLFMRSNLRMGTQAAGAGIGRKSLKNDNNFVPEVIDCNRGQFPPGNRAVYEGKGGVPPSASGSATSTPKSTPEKAAREKAAPVASVFSGVIAAAVKADSKKAAATVKPAPAKVDGKKAAATAKPAPAKADGKKAAAAAKPPPAAGGTKATAPAKGKGSVSVLTDKVSKLKISKP